MSFNLTAQPWIPVVTQTWQRQELSLIELFQTWRQFREIQAENPPTTLALYRLLLAILHQVYQGPNDVDHWEEIAADEGQQAIAYLQEQADRFDLLHPARPFMQDPGIPETAAGEVYLAADLHGNNTSTIFCHYHQWRGASLSLAEAARLVVRLQVFDVSGRKTGASQSAAVIPTMDAANVIVRGKDLRETLLLNLMEYDPERSRPCEVKGQDLPVWERDLQPARERVPAGYIDYLTYPWRRVRIFLHNDRVVRIAVHPSDRLPKSSHASQWECGIAYRQTKKGLQTVILKLDRSLWRDSAVFLQSAADSATCPKILQWLAYLQEDKLAAENLELQVFGLSVDNAKPLGWVSEQFSAPMPYLTDPKLWEALNLAIGIAEEYQQIFRTFRGSPYSALAQGLNPPETGADAISKQAKQLAATLAGEAQYWATLDREFRLLLDALLGKKDLDTADINPYRQAVLSQWRTDIVEQAARKAFTDSIVSIRNYEARARSLRRLEYHIRKLRGEDDPSDKKQKSSKTRKSGKAA